jgi:hypothetical protein
VAGAEAARRHLAVLAASPRPAGGPAEGAARDYCARLLRDLGFSVREEPFEYSALPGRYATPLVGVCAAVALAWAAFLGWRGNPGGALAVLVGVGLPVALGAAWLGTRGVLALPWGRARGVNLTAERGAPLVWLVAHLDSKSQPVPIGVRALGITLTVVAWLAAATLALVELAGASMATVWPWLGAGGVLAAIPVAASTVGARSPGALDNASGVTAVLLVVAELPRDWGVGVVLTSAEELGLAGARAWLRGRAAARAVNFDGLDDAGEVQLVWTGRRPVRLLSTLLAAAARTGVRARAARLLPGILVDGVAFADAGWEVVTASKGTTRTVGRIHTFRDDLTAVDGRGVAEVASLVASALRESE